MATAEIAAAMASIPSKKEELRKAFETLQAFSSCLASFTLKWKDLEDHLASIESLIGDRLRELDSKSHSSVMAEANPETAPEGVPRRELSCLCVNMDGVGLRSYIIVNRNDIAEIRNELGAAIRSAPDPAKLVLDAMDGFHRPRAEGEKDGDVQVIKRTCLSLLEQVQILAPEIKSSVKDQARKVAAEWKGKILDDNDKGMDAFAFLQLVATYRLASEFNTDEILDLFVLISRRKQALDLCKRLGLVQNMSDLIQKLNSKSRQLEAIKFVHALDLFDKYPPVPLLEAYLKESRKAAQGARKRGNNSSQLQNEAISKELAAAKAVIKTVEECKLESEFSCEDLQKRITQLEQQKADKKRTATVATATISRTSKQQQPSNKRPRSSTTFSYPVHSHPLPSCAQNQSHLGLIEQQSSYMGLGRSYGLTTTAALYDAAPPSIPGTVELSGKPSPRSYLYPSEFHASSSLYNRPASYGGYPVSGLGTSYGSSFYSLGYQK
ncbi:Frigida-like protein [Musa troglodytarum]|uniref:FRIGIDA-like protein n=1 Tax=Musa troglodytarum TaxID=320322 RepID=A0A9E7GBW8_9LILI|nr:Frigida-like protein [Musa troglodytarum]